MSAFYLVTWKKQSSEDSSRGLGLPLSHSGLYSTQNLGTVLERAVAADGKLADPMNAEIAILKFLIYRKRWWPQFSFCRRPKSTACLNVGSTYSGP
jgi:hypothetical protein